MKRILCALIAACASVGAAASELLVRDATIWSEAGPHTHRDLLIRDGVVVRTARTGAIRAAAGARIVEANGDALLPGLIDAHVHLVSGVRLPEDFGALDRARVAARQLLRSGVTSGRIHLWNLPDAAAFAREASATGYPAPRMTPGGPGLFGNRPDWNSDTGNVWGFRDAADRNAKLARLHAAGVRWVTLHELQDFAAGEVAATIIEAHRLGLRVAVAGDRLEALGDAIDADADSVEYLDRSDAPLYPPELVARMRARKSAVFLVPAVGFPHRYAAYRSGAMDVSDARLTEFMPAPVAGFAAAAMRDDRTQPIRYAPTWTKLPASISRKFKQLAASGLPLVTGTDCGSPMHVQVDAIWWELETWRRLGVPLRDIVRGATSRGAELLGDARAGSLRAGSYGDFVLVRGALDEGELNVSRVRAVARDGVLFVDEGKWVGPQAADAPTTSTSSE